MGPSCKTIFGGKPCRHWDNAKRTCTDSEPYVSKYTHEPMCRLNSDAVLLVTPPTRDAGLEELKRYAVKYDLVRSAIWMEEEWDGTWLKLSDVEKLIAAQPDGRELPGFQDMRTPPPATDERFRNGWYGGERVMYVRCRAAIERKDKEG